MGRNQHVVPQRGRWVVEREGSKKATSVHETQKQAIEAAREIARNQKSELVIHRRDGRFRGRISYGNDPFPPKG